MDQSIRILVVDDEPDIRRIIRILLEGRGYHVTEAPNGRLAVQAAQQDLELDLIILDIMMPELSGIEASKEIRRISSAPILFLTARTQEQDKLEAYQSGGDDYLAKPFSHGELLMKVDSLIRRSASTRARSQASSSKATSCSTRKTGAFCAAARRWS